MGDLPKKLEAKWKIQHEKDAEAAFAKVASEGQKSAGPSFFRKAEVKEEKGAVIAK